MDRAMMSLMRKLLEIKKKIFEDLNNEERKFRVGIVTDSNEYLKDTDCIMFLLKGGDRLNDRTISIDFFYIESKTNKEPVKKPNETDEELELRDEKSFVFLEGVNAFENLLQEFELGASQFEFLNFTTEYGDFNNEKSRDSLRVAKINLNINYTRLSSLYEDDDNNYKIMQDLRLKLKLGGVEEWQD